MKIKKMILYAIVLGAMVFGCNKEQDKAPEPAPDPSYVPSGYTLSFSDEFDATNLDAAKWGWGSTPWNAESQNSCTINLPEDSYLEDGSLINRSRKGPFNGASKSYAYSTGWAWTKEWRTGGYLEIRAQYPSYRGAWPAFWMLGEGWPPEIDIAEYRGIPRSYMTMAYYDGSWSSNTRGGDYTGWHVYGLEWSPESLKWYIDGELVHSYTGASVPNTAMYVILSGGVDCTDSDGTGFPNYYKIDYFRWYQKDTHPGPPAAPTNLSAAPQNGKALLTWDKNKEWDIAGYNIYSSTSASGPYTLLKNTTDNRYTDLTAVDGTMYYYKVSAIDIAGNESTKSNEVSFTSQKVTDIVVENFSFELPNTTKQNNWSNIPGWKSDTQATDSGVEMDGSTTDGNWRAYLMNGDPSVWNLTSHTIASGETFIIQLDAISSYMAPDIAVNLYYDTGNGVRNLIGTKTFTIDTSYKPYGVSIQATDASVGSHLGIEIRNPTSGWLGFDNVKLGVMGQ